MEKVDTGIIVFGALGCGACMALKRKLESSKVAYSYTADEEALKKASEESGLLSLPIVRIGDKYYNAAEASTLLYL